MINKIELEMLDEAMDFVRIHLINGYTVSAYKREKPYAFTFGETPIESTRTSYLIVATKEDK